MAADQSQIINNSMFVLVYAPHDVARTDLAYSEESTSSTTYLYSDQ